MPAKNKRRLLAWMVLLISSVVYGAAAYSRVKVDPDSGRVVINFILPVRRDPEPPRIETTPEIPGTPVTCKVGWTNRTTMVLELDQKGRPEGQLIKFKVDGVPTIVPFVRKSAKGEVRRRVPLTLLSGKSPEKVPSRGPVPLIFNTPVDPVSLKKSVVLPAPGRLDSFSLTFGGRVYSDYSRWQYIPDAPLENGATYRITVEPGVRSSGGTVLGKRQEIIFTTAARPKVTGTSPAYGQKGVPLYRTVEFYLDQEIHTASIRVTGPREEAGVPGSVEISHRRVVFRPEYAFSPNSTYRAVLQAGSAEHERSYEYELSFTTVDMGERLWVEVKLGEKHTVTVFKGSKVVRHMPASGGRPESPTPTGYFYTQDRGHSFWSPKFGEGATYWVRLVGQILVHSVPKDSRWRTKEEEHEKLGLPASHGCIRLDEKDAKWFFENIPRGTLVIVHE